MNPNAVPKTIGRMIVMMNVKVLGGGCSKCETLLANVKEAIEKYLK